VAGDWYAEPRGIIGGSCHDPDAMKVAMDKGGFPKATGDDISWFDTLLPDRPGVTRKAMFGNVAGFAGDAMFLCLLGDRIAVRLDDAARAELLAHAGAEPFEPMPGRAMKEYVMLPPAWRDDPARAREWVERSAAYAATIPPKKPKKRPAMGGG
jgi:TfoX/Sxy family transcriptional regulator of competence genes